MPRAAARWACALGFAILLLPLAARAEGGPAQGDAVKCTILSIHGREAAGGIDKRLAKLRKKLSKPPFSAFKSFALLEAKDLELSPAAAKEVKLPTGKTLQLTFKEKLLQRRSELRLRLHFSIMPPKGTRPLTEATYAIENGGTLLVAGDSLRGGTLVVGITCQAQ